MRSLLLTDTTTKERFSKVTFFASPQQIERLKAASERRGLTQSELFRRALDYWLDEEEQVHETKPGRVSRN